MATGLYECLWSDLSPYTGPPPREGSCPPNDYTNSAEWCGFECDDVACPYHGQCAGVSSERAFGICTVPLDCDPLRPEAWPSDGWYRCDERRPCSCMQLGSPLGWSHGIFVPGRGCEVYLARYGPDHVRCTPLGRRP